jgi:Delta24(24(1))-sterol reductase
MASEPNTDIDFLHRKKEHFDGMVETPARRSSRRQSSVPAESTDHDNDSSSAAETTSRARSVRRRTAPKFPENLEEEEEAKPTANGTKTSNGSSKDTMALNGSSKGINAPARKTETKTKGVPKDPHVVDGWKPGQDPKIDYSGEFEFGGSLGTGALMLLFPILMWYMWAGATYYDGKFPSRQPGQTWPEFGFELVNLVYNGAFPHAKAWLYYWSYLIFEAACYCLLPGVTGYGKPLAHEGGKQLPYFCNAYLSLYFTLAVMAVLHYTGIWPLYTALDEFGPMLSVAILSGFIVSFVAYFSCLWRGRQHRMTGYPIYDFFMGAELNPRLFGIIDFKMFFEVRIPWYMLLIISLGAAARQYEQYGYVSAEVMFLVMAHYLYANACSKGEELIITTWYDTPFHSCCMSRLMD